MRMPWTRRFITHLALVLGLVWASDHLLVSLTLGVGCALLVGVTALVIPLRAVASRRAWPHVLRAVAYTVAAAGALAVTGSGFALLAAAGGLMLASSGTRADRYDAAGLRCRAIARSLPRVALTLAVDATTVLRLRAHGRRGWPLVAAILPWMVPVVGGGLFLGLFMQANPVVKQLVGRIWTWLTQAGWPSLGQVAIWLVAGCGAWTLLRGRWRGRLPASTAGAHHRDHRALAIRCMWLFNLVFLLHNALDAAYLWGGRTLPRGMTYASYAQQGSHTLLITALLAAAIMLLWFRPGSPIEASRGARLLLFTWLAQNVVVMLGAAERLWRYVAVYGLTRWRLGAGIWMVLVVIGLLLIGWRIFRRRDNGWLIDANLGVMAVVVLALGWTDADALIAWQNVRHLAPRAIATPQACTWDHEPDVTYLRSLGPSAIPALDWLGHQHPATWIGQESRQAVVGLVAALRQSSCDWQARTLRTQAVLRTYPTR